MKELKSGDRVRTYSAVWFDKHALPYIDGTVIGPVLRPPKSSLIYVDSSLGRLKVHRMQCRKLGKKKSVPQVFIPASRPDEATKIMDIPDWVGNAVLRISLGSIVLTVVIVVALVAKLIWMLL